MSFDHVAFQVSNIKESIDWYQEHYSDCKELYSDQTWGMIEIAGVRVALVLGDTHPPHIAINQKGPIAPDAKMHRDGSYYIYDADPDGNVIERLWWPENLSKDE